MARKPSCRPLGMSTWGTHELPLSLVRGALLLVLCLAFGADERQAHAGGDTGEALVELAHARGLASQREWLRLLHFGNDLTWRFESEVDGRTFFLSPTGKRDASAELDATLRAFASPWIAGHRDDHALCRFPARRAWLDRQVHFLQRPPDCPSLDRASEVAALSRVSFVYASNYVGNPASAFGHAFLHLQVRAPPSTPWQERDRKDFGAEFRAVTTTKNPLSYAFMGISGLFQGKIEVISYEKQIERYGITQGRDLWEYDLALTDAELKMLWLHLWEMEATELDYYYLGRNCAYEVLRLLEVAAPRLDLLHDLKPLVFPLDTLTAITRVPGLVVHVSYRASRRHAMELPAGEPIAAPAQKDPSLEHGPMRITYGAGGTSQYGNGFVTLGYRLALHDLTDPPDGWASLSQVEILDARLRYDLERRVLTVDRMTFADLTALHPLNLEPRLSWRVSAFGDRLHDRACEDCFAHGLDGSVGATLATRGRAVAFFVMADTFAAFLPELSGFGASFVRLGAGPYAGLRVEGSGTSALLTGSLSYLPWEKINDTFDLRLTVKTALAKNAAVGVEAKAQPLSVEAQLAGYVYF